VNSILNNSAALSALQSLNMTQQALATTQHQVSSGLKVASASDNAAYWSIGTQLTSDSGVVSAANDALSQSQAVLGTATSAVNSIITTINSIQTALTQATNPGADIGKINTTLASLGQQLTDAVKGASFNGLNLLDGSQTAPLNFVSGFNASVNGGSFNYIGFTAQALTGNGTTATTSVQPNITDTTTISQLNALADNTASVTTPSYGVDKIDKTTDTTHDTFSISSVSLSGVTTKTTYTGLDANGNLTTAAAATSFGVSVTTTPPAGLLTQSGVDLTNITTSAATAGTQLTAVEQALAAVTSYSATIGATQNRMTAANTFNASLVTDYTNGVSSLVDANMNEASTRLQALQTQEQLGIQSLSIANQNAQLILKLFQ
jgi:flagellin